MGYLLMEAVIGHVYITHGGILERDAITTIIPNILITAEEASRFVRNGMITPPFTGGHFSMVILTNSVLTESTMMGITNRLIADGSTTPCRQTTDAIEDGRNDHKNFG
jgi:hypothetical protein